MRPSGRSSVWLLMAAAGAAAVCCAGPTLLVLAATGFRVGALNPGVSLLAGICGGRVEYRKSRVVAPARLRPFHRPDDPKFQ